MFAVARERNNMIEDYFFIRQNALAPKIASGLVALNDGFAADLFNYRGVGNSRPAAMNLFDSLTALVMPVTLALALFFWVGSYPLLLQSVAFSFSSYVKFIAIMVGGFVPLAQFVARDFPPSRAPFFAACGVGSIPRFVVSTSAFFIGVIPLEGNSLAAPLATPDQFDATGLNRIKVLGVQQLRFFAAITNAIYDFIGWHVHPDSVNVLARPVRMFQRSFGPACILPLFTRF